MAKAKPGVEIDQEYELVPIDSISEHPQNYNIGDEEAIDESIEANGWYGTVTVQTSTRLILAGNHRYRVAKKRGAKQIPVIWKDVDDQTAGRILLADNLTARAARIDQQMLDTLLEGLETLEGTGYGQWAVAEAERAEEAPEEASDANGDDPAPDAPIPDDAYEPSYGVMVVCEDEEQQRTVYEKLQKEGYVLRVVAV